MNVWVDLTTSYTWNRPAVGIVRVELEILRQLSKREDDNIKFFRYDNDLSSFFELSKAEVIAVVDRITLDNTVEITNNESLKVVKDLKPKFFNLRQNELKHFSVQLIKNLAFLLLSFIHPQYHLKVKVKLNNSKSILKRFLYKLKAKNDHIEHIHDVPKTDVKNNNLFSRGDKILSVGAVWNYININEDFYLLKRELDLKIYSISYDLIPIFKPHLCLDYVSSFFPKFYNELCWYSEHIFCISESTKADLVDFISETGVPEPTLSVVTLGSDIPKSNNEIKNQALIDFVEDVGDFVLFVSTIERRKNHELIYKVITRWIDQGITDFPQFVFVGMPGWGTQDLMKDIATDPRVVGHIHILNNMSDDELAYLYEKSIFTVYPSLYEGWGLPISESLSYGKFCIASDSSSMPEAGCGLIDLVEPFDILGWSDKIRHYYNDRDDLAKRELIIENNYIRPQWSELTTTIINKVIGK